MTRHRLLLLGSAVLAESALLALAGCPDRPIAAPMTQIEGSSVTRFNASQDKAVDILFMIDNSPSMSPKQKILASQFQSFIQVIDASGADYHVGIVTSDCGALPSPSVASDWTALGSACDTVSGDNGALQNIPCTSRPSSDYFLPMEQSLCNTICPTAITPIGKKMMDGSIATPYFIASTGGMNPDVNVPVPSGMTTEQAVETAFACMAYVGDTGCGIEMQMEATERALDGMTNPGTNQYFLRQDALLAVIYITDEDDCSVQDRTKNDPNTMNCYPGGSAMPNWACFNPDYRCYAEGTTCTSGTLDQPGPKSGCAPKTGSYLYDVSHYTAFFDSLKMQPGRVLMYGIVSPAGGPVDIEYNDGPANDTGNLNRAVPDSPPGGTPACDSGQTDAISGREIIGKPQVRLHQFLSHYPGIEHSVCDINNYNAVLQDIAKHIVKTLGAACVPPLRDYGAGMGTPASQCNVYDQNAATGVTTPPYPECSYGCCNALANDPNGSMTDVTTMSACGGETQAPCWCAVKSAAGKCADPANPTLIGLWRGSTTAPSGDTTVFNCQESLGG